MGEVNDYIMIFLSLRQVKSYLAVLICRELLLDFSSFSSEYQFHQAECGDSGTTGIETYLGDQRHQKAVINRLCIEVMASML